MSRDHLTGLVLDNVPRMLSWIDRRPGSPTYGCADRNFWHYRIVDFPCAMLQETALTLALLHTVNFEGNRYHGDPEINRIARAQIGYWIRIQKRSGAFDEFFPNEHSFSATAFTLYAVLSAVQLLDVPSDAIFSSSRKACRFLTTYGDPGASNQVAAAVAALGLHAVVFGESEFDGAREALLSGLLNASSDEGWTPEYGGFDVGYQSITLSYLADHHRRYPSDTLGAALDRMVEFLAHFIHPDGSSGGTYGSRNTPFLAPYGFASLARENDRAHAVMRRVFFGSNRPANRFLDDRYICHFVLPSYLMSVRDFSASDGAEEVLPCDREGSVDFPDAGIRIFSNTAYFFVCSAPKQGAFYMYRRTTGAARHDAGYTVRDGRDLQVTNWMTERGDVDVQVGDDAMTISGHLFSVPDRIPTTLFHAGLRCLTALFGRQVLRVLKRYFITSRNSTGRSFTRTFLLKREEVVVRDDLDLSDAPSADVRLAAGGTGFRYVAPSNYYLGPTPNEEVDGDMLSVNASGHVLVERSF